MYFIALFILSSTCLCILIVRLIKFIFTLKIGLDDYCPLQSYAWSMDYSGCRLETTLPRLIPLHHASKQCLTSVHLDENLCSRPLPEHWTEQPLPSSGSFQLRSFPYTPHRSHLTRYRIHDCCVDGTFQAMGDSLV